MYVNHRTLNHITVNNKCLIPIIDELLDKLGGAQQISKFGFAFRIPPVPSS